MNGKQLKNSILQWAIQGKLVPQDPNEGTAEDLLKEIRAEKERLVKEGKLKKKDLVFSDIYKDEDGKWWENTGKETVEITEEIPFEIPSSWKWVRLKQLVSLITKGSSPSWQGVKYVDNGILFITSENVREGYLDLTAPKYLEEKFNSLQSRSILTKGDLLTNIVGASIGRTALFDLDDNNCNINQAVAIIRLLRKACNPFFLKLLNSPFVIIQMFGKTVETARPNISLGSVENLFIPLPPLAEQKRIVEKIEELMPLVDQYGKSQEKLNKLNEAIYGQLEKSILQEAIQGKLVPQDPNEGTAEDLLKEIRAEKERLVKEGKLSKKDLVLSIIYKEDDKWFETVGKETKEITEDIPFEIPESWSWCRMGTIGSWGAGATPQRGCSDYYNKGTIPWIKTGELNNGVVYDSEEKITEKALKECSLRLNKVGDVMIAMYGATIGKVAIVGKELTTNQACCACTPVLLYNYYLFYFLMASKEAFMKLGAGGAQPNISRDKLINYLFPLPPLAEQKRIVEKITGLRAIIKTVN
ncbi:MAG: restriction endonuclease subunit S [Paludibacteraceae bacterium]|nr:restriction endonuclease subunit S [Paludibacteraceae bacterium]